MKIKRTKRKINEKEKLKPFVHGQLLFGGYLINNCCWHGINGTSEKEVISNLKKYLKEMIDSFHIEIINYHD